MGTKKVNSAGLIRQQFHELCQSQRITLPTKADPHVKEHFTSSEVVQIIDLLISAVGTEMDVLRDELGSK
jgi:hypothetical protein